ncbi:ATPase, AAA family [Hyphomicrobium sp. 1Nfss2.1]|uniref:AAA family ATPase n=1 Tax=Hyphomicrobium sp. 1Nfss2.1 TaxID=3413936 RepID=UPI003C7C18EF
MKLELERRFVEALSTRFDRLSGLSDQLRFANKAEVSFRSLEADEIAFLCQLLREAGTRFEPRAAHLATLQNALLDESGRLDASSLEDALVAIARYLTSDAIRGWMFATSVLDKPLPYVVTRIDYVPASSEESGKIFIELKANAKGALTSVTLRVTDTDLSFRSVGELFAAKGFLKETPELVAAYDEIAERYLEWRALNGTQFSGQGIGYYAEDPSATHRDMDWSRKDIVVLSTSGSAVRLVNDESVLRNRSLTLEAPGDILGSYLRKAGKSNRFEAEDEIRAIDDAMPEGLFKRMPVHPFILMFHMELHHYLWVHAGDITPYEYSPDLRHKLVLPREQTDLIDILTAEMDVLMDDIVAGKSGGTTVLCAGPPGVGKTLTAEVYSEFIKRPLYRVHSGQLGLNVAAMETALKDVLTRAQRWGAVMLIDEADVYIRRRDDDMTANAVVGVFLRVLEYFNGLLFLTTNRVDDIDEAIVSRCIALIRFHAPDSGSRRRIWEVMAGQFGLALEPSLMDELAETFPEATGRDIKGLAKLVAKWCQHKSVAPTLEVFLRCSVFRGMDADKADGGELVAG